jgi:A-macroglobulin complement component/alpha-2-macroglobulin family protein/MG2 domain-containing protein/carboxypeptidase family protein/A-macroglobulin receptor/macroglobulin-like protein
MRRTWRSVALFIGLGSLWSIPVLGQQALRMDEEHIRLHLEPSPFLELPLTNSADQPVDRDFLLEILGDNGIAASRSGKFHAKPGQTTQRIPWTLAELPSYSPSKLGWSRLRYSLTPSSGVTPLRGVVQLGPLITDAFELRITAAATVTFGAKYPVRVRVDNPSNGHPCAGIPVELELVIEDDDDHPVQRKVITDSSGYAVAVFDLTANPSASRGEVTATATRGSLAEQESIKFEFQNESKVTLTTDKPLYRPGQTLHMRLLAFGPNHEAFEGRHIELAVEDSEGEETYRTTATTSRFGVATADWDIPQKLRLGEYSIHAEVQDEKDKPQTGARIRISRYELPEFTVTVKPDRPYYLPGQDARFEVNAEYLFGKPVQRAKVKVVKQDDRQWNAKDEKWEAEESDAVEGEFDSSGKAILPFRLEKSFEDLPESRYQRFQDLAMAAYVTDLSSGRTEQRRFKVRVTSEPIHLYLTADSEYSLAQPLRVYVTASYADGTPASVTGVLEAARPNDAGDFDDKPDAAHRFPMGKFHTNRLGVARLDLPLLPENLLIVQHYYGWERQYGRSDESQISNRLARFLLRAADAKGLSGHYSDDLYLARKPDYIVVRTDRKLYHPGEDLVVTVVSSTHAREVIANVASSGGLLSTQVVKLNHGRAEFAVPYDARFRGQIDVFVHAMSGVPESDRALGAMAAVIYPAPQELRVGVRMPKTTFRPGENASVDVRVKSPDGKAAASDLGVLVFDRAVADRVRSDEEFGQEYGFSIFDYYSDYQNSVGGISYRDLLNLNAREPFSSDLELVAELILRYSPWDSAIVLAGGSSNYARDAASYFNVSKDPDILKVGRALDQRYSAGDYPRTESEFRQILKAASIDPGSVRDPWDIAYRPVFSVSGADDVLSLVSNGVDKKPDTADDFEALNVRRKYFRKIGLAIEGAVRGHLKDTREYIRDYQTLRDELKKQNISLDSLQDPWGTPYRYSFGVSGPYFTIAVDSAGPDHLFDIPTRRSHDDVSEWQSSIRYFQQETSDLSIALAEYFATTGKFPKSEEDLKPVIQAAKLTPEKLLDPWGNPYHFSFTTQSRYADRIDVRNESTYQADPQKKTTVTPVTQELAYILVTSYGPENKSQGAFQVAEFSRVLTEMSSKDIRAMSTAKEPPRPGGTGGISGQVTDPSGAVVAAVSVTATSVDTAQEYITRTDEMGSFLFVAIPTGTYRLEFAMRGFRTTLVVQVPVENAGTTRVDATLAVGGSSETVEVSAEALTLETSQAQVSGTRRRSPGTESAPAGKPLFTPRLRQYFPETLLWRPEIVTDENGNASFNFPMADNITAWKMSIIASTRQGRVGVAEKELRTFQPFFIVHDPPPVLTEGDRISLPVILRNYSEKKQTLETELLPQPWFTILSPARQNVTVAANNDATAVFSLRASASVKKGAQRVSARNTETGDAVERQVLVHPDGQEISFTTAAVLGPHTDSLDIDIPDTAIRGSAEAELRVYPNLVAHILDAMRGLARQPAGCNEQITSIGYSNLLVLRALKKIGQGPNDPRNPRSLLAAEAQTHLQDAYWLLVHAQRPDGSIGYWKSTDPDVALTAYFLRFLAGASEFIEVDAGAVSRTQGFLLAMQSKSGAWKGFDWRNKKETDNANVSAYVIRALATTRTLANNQDAPKVEQAISRGLDYVETQIESWNDAYLVGNYAIAAAASGRDDRIARVQPILTSIAHREGDTTYWNLEANTTPFYGWGFAGRLETTALAVEALTLLYARHPEGDTQEINRGLQFLLRHKDRYAMWYSTQASQNVIEALLAALPAAPESTRGVDAAVVVDGKEIGTIKLPPSQEISGPIVLELDQYLQKGTNKIQIARPGVEPLNAAVVARYYIPSTDATSTTEENRRNGDTRALLLKVHFDRTDLDLKDPVTCSVQAERIGFKGYGMMLAEIGLPPGADVDRASLEKEKEEGLIDAYDVQPDRVVFYLWPPAGGSKFEFRFHSRLRMEAKSGPSLLYDYYNPDATATVSPVRFVVH